MSILRPGDRILFQGDSITDCGRNDTASGGLGYGYVAVVAGMLAARRPDLRTTIINRGVSGDRTVELLARWRYDALDLRPDVLSIMVGVNDIWRKMASWNGQTHVDLPAYERNVRALCAQARAGGVRELVLVSPTTIHRDDHHWANRMTGEYADWLKMFAAEIGATWVDARRPLLLARATNPQIPWTPDGCHPGTAGHGLIAAAWYGAVVG